jgi:ABC-type glycerol-3-phosphate transport system substrate-binding protein
VHASRSAQDPSRRGFLERSVVVGSALVMGAGVLGTASRAMAASMSAGFPPLNPAVVGEVANLRLWLLPELAAHPAYLQAIALFRKAYPSVQVQITPVAKDDILTRYKIAVAAGGGSAVPDIVSHHAYIFGAQGLAHESDALWAAYGQEPAFLPAAMQDVTWRIDKFGIPLVSNAILTIVNADMFDKAGVALPTASTTFDQFLALVSRVKRAHRTRYAMILSADGATATALVHANGGELMQTVHGRNIARLTDGRVTDALDFYTALAWKQRLAPMPPAPTSNRNYLAQYFVAGLAPAFFGTMSDVGLIQQAGGSPRVAIAPLPGGTTGRTTGSVSDGASLVITGATRKPHAAFELGTWLVAPSPAVGVARTLRLAPTVESTYRDPYFHADRMTSTYFEVARTASPVGLDAYSEPYTLYLGALRQAFAGKSAKAALGAIQGPCQAAMDKADAGLDSDG